MQRKWTMFVVAVGILFFSTVLNIFGDSQDSAKRHDSSVKSGETVVHMDDGVYMRNGHLVLVRKGRATTLTDDMVLGDGTRVLRSGMVRRKDGTEVRIREGQMYDMSGRRSDYKWEETKSENKMDDHKQNDRDQDRSR